MLIIGKQLLFFEPSLVCAFLHTISQIGKKALPMVCHFPNRIQAPRREPFYPFCIG